MKPYYLIFLMFFGILAIAQPLNPNNPSPLGFIEVLAIGGAVYGARRLYRRKNS